MMGFILWVYVDCKASPHNGSGVAFPQNHHLMQISTNHCDDEDNDEQELKSITPLSNFISPVFPTPLNLEVKP